MHLHPPLVDQGIKAIVQAASGDPQKLGNLALRQVGAALQDAQHPKVGVLLELRSTACHQRESKYFGRATAILGQHYTHLQDEHKIKNLFFEFVRL